MTSIALEQAPTEKVAIYARINDPRKAEPAKRAAIYASSATRSQEVMGMTSFEQQIAEGRQHCAEHGYTLDEQHIYQEIIGEKRERNRSYLPELDAMRNAAKKQQFDVLVVFSIDRLARDLRYRTMLLEELTQAGITVESIDGCTLDAAAWRQVQQIATEVTQEVAQVERQKIISRMQHGKAAKKALREQQQ